MATNHNPIQLLCILLTFPVAVVTTLVAIYALLRQCCSANIDALSDLLRSDLQEVADGHPSPISPASWVHWLWVSALGWQVIWSLYALISICRKTVGVPVYTSPVLLPAVLLLLFMFSCGFNVAWFITYDREYVSTSCLFIFLTTIMSLAAYSVSVSALRSNVFRLEKAERHGEIWVTRLLVNNGLAYYSMWSLFVMAFNITLALIHSKADMDTDVATIVGMSIIAFVILTYFLIDVVWLDRYARYVITPYVVPIIVLSACLFRQGDWRSDDVNFIYLATLLSFAFVSLMIKSACAAFRIMNPRSNGGEITSSGPGTPVDEAHYLLKD